MGRISGMKGKHHSSKTKQKMSLVHKNRRVTWGNKISKSKKGKEFSLAHRLALSLARRLKVEGNKVWNWKGDKVGYRALHHWVHRKLGKPSFCSFCGKKKTTPKSIHWSNVSKNYRRDTSDWISLCAKCHKKYDKKV